MWFSIDIQCRACNEVWDEVVLREEKDRQDFECQFCGEKQGHRIMSKPNVTRASYPDGVKRAGFQKLREQDKIERELSNARTAKEKVYIAQERDKVHSKKS